MTKKGDDEKNDDRRVAKTKGALISAFNDLVISGRKKNIRVSDIVEHANVGRSTFYEHYASADDIHMKALAAPLSILADCIVGTDDEKNLTKLLEHFWANRQRARATFLGESRDRVTRLLADLIEERVVGEDTTGIPMRMAVVQLADGALSPLRTWITGEAPCSASTLAEAICKVSASARDTLIDPRRSEQPVRRST